MAFGLLKMFFKALAQFVRCGGLRHFWKRFDQLIFCVIEILEFIEIQLAQSVFRHNSSIEFNEWVRPRNLRSGTLLCKFPLSYVGWLLVERLTKQVGFGRKQPQNSCI